jgi:ATP-dependent DNA helicase RecQ
LSAVYRSNQSFGQNHIIDILRGSTNQKIYQFEHDKLSVYGIGTDKSKNEWGAIVDRLLDIDALSIGEHRALKITNYGLEDILKKKQTVLIDEDKIGIVEKDKEPKQDKEYSQFFNEFRQLRAKFANEEGVPAYIVFSDKVLVDLSDKLPQTKEEMLLINGIGEAKLEKYGEEFLNLCIELKPSQKKKLTKTFQETLELIEEQKDIKTIANEKNVQTSTIVGHAKLLCEHGKISEQKVEELIEPLIEEFPNELKSWCEEGLREYDIKELRNYLNLYENLFLTEKQIKNNN